MKIGDFWPAVQEQYWAFESDHVSMRDGEEQAYYESVLRELHGMTTSNVMGLLNAACRCMEAGEYYLELGTYRGSTLIGALTANAALAIAVDNWSNESPDGKDNRAEFEANIRHFDVADRVRFTFAEDIVDVLAHEPLPVGVAFVDGNHQDAEDTLRTLTLLEPWLAPNAVVIMDDANMPKIHEGAHAWIARQPHATLLVDRRTPTHMHHSFWNGLLILGWKAE